MAKKVRLVTVAVAAAMAREVAVVDSRVELGFVESVTP